ncbi:MAG: type IV secretion system protein [Rhodanobacter sp.]
MGNLGDYVYFALVYKYLQKEITTFQDNVLASMMSWASAIALVLITLWIMIQGYRMITGQSRGSMMAMVMNMARIAIIVTAATSMSIFGGSLQGLLSANGELGSGISQMVSGATSPIDAIDRNMAATQLTLAAIDVVQVAPGDTQSVEQKAHAELIAGFGSAGPAMAAGAMLLLYQFTMGLFIGLGPLFILCLIFDQTKDLFRKWLMYGIGTLFSVAMLCVVSSMVLKLTENVAAALWTASIVNSITGLGAEGFSSQALQQGGIGLLLTVLVISVPPLAAAFFQGTVGNFMPYAAFGGGATSRPGPQGQPPGSYGGGYGGGYAPQTSNTGEGNSGVQSSGGFTNPTTNAHATSLARSAGNAVTATMDQKKSSDQVQRPQ